MTTTPKRLLGSAILSLALTAALSVPAYADIMYADHVTRLLEGDPSVGDFSGWYGGTFPGTYPVPLTEAQAIASVLGPPDGAFLSLPGRNDTPSGSGFRYDYVEVGFPSNFDENNLLLITELGANAESAQLWIWTLDGSNIQPIITRDGSDTLVVDLRSFAWFVDAHGGAFNRVGIGGLDLLGASKGFDLDAVGIAAVPEPSTIILLGVGLVGLGIWGRKRVARQAEGKG